MPCILTFGPTRVGKSSFINTYSGQHLVDVGDERGISTTSVVSVYNVVPVGRTAALTSIVDVPGLDDTRLEQSNKQIRHKIEIALLERFTCELDAVLVFQSLAGDSMTMLISLVQLQQLFGQEITTSVVVVFTKETNSAAKKSHYESVCNEIKVPFVYWRNSYSTLEETFNLPQETLADQIGNLLEKVSKVKKYDLEQVRQNAAEITRRATEMREKEPIEYETREVEVERDTVEEYLHPVERERVVMRKVWDGDLGRILGKKRNEATVEKYWGNEVRYRTHRVTEKKQIQVQRPKKDLQYYLEIVKKEKVEELRRALAN
jgi:GTP-binding protein EngB required for normal cell division